MPNLRVGRAVDVARDWFSRCWLPCVVGLLPACAAAAPAPDRAPPAATLHPALEPGAHPSASEAGKDPDLAFVNAKIFTSDPARPWARALAIVGDHISAVGTDAEVRRTLTSRTRVIDLAGQLVIPGINDAHVHEPRVWSRVDIDTRGLTSVTAVIDRVASEAARHPEGTWLRAGDLPPSFADDPALVRTELDRKLPRHPALFVLLGDHAACLNGAALEAWHIDEGSRPVHGRQGRTEAGKLDGWLYEYALWSHYPAMAEAESDDAVAAAAERFAQRAVRFGITSVQTMPTHIPSERLARVLSARATPLRWRLIRFPQAGIQALQGSVPAPPLTDRVRLDGIKYILDGTPIERGAGLLAGYHDRPRQSGHLDFSDAELASIFERSWQSGVPLLLHVSGDAPVEQALRIMQRQGGLEAWSTRRVRFEHGDGVSAFLDQLERAKIVVVQNPLHFALPPGVTERFSAEQHAALLPLRSLLGRGIAVALGSDAELNPFLGILLASVHPANPGEAITREQALVAYTRGSAYAEFAELVKGTLAPGMLADLAVLSQDIFEVSNEQLPATASVLTLVGGRVVFSAAAREGGLLVPNQGD